MEGELNPNLIQTSLSYPIHLSYSPHQHTTIADNDNDVRVNPITLSILLLTVTNNQLKYYLSQSKFKLR